MDPLRPFRPMLAAQMGPVAELRFPVWASPKIDGLRCLAMNGRARSRTMKLIPNRSVQRFFEQHAKVLNGLDGELVIGEPTAGDCYTRSVSGLMSHDGEPDFTYLVFDRWDQGGAQFEVRNLSLFGMDFGAAGIRVRVLPQSKIINPIQLEAEEEAKIGFGYEGLILRSPSGGYKQNRSTWREQGMVKVKRFADFEAKIVGMIELMHNDNEKTVSELGLTTRSSHQANQTPSGVMGALTVIGLDNSPFPGERFQIGTGFTSAQRAEFWASRAKLVGRTVVVKYLPAGVKDLPRHPVFKGFRGEADL